MAECIIARGGSAGASTQIPIVSDRCSLLVTVKDSEGGLLSDLSVHCKDGNTWYNYHTNDRGQVLFMCNSGSANITAWNFSINGNFKFMDQAPQSLNVDTPIAQIIDKTISLGIANEFNKCGMTNNIYDENKCYDGWHISKHYNRANIFLGGGGGAGGGGTFGLFHGGGGAGGAIIRNNIEIQKDYNYLLYAGDGGIEVNDIGGTGGTTTAFGYSVVGGTGGNGTSGGIHGSGDFNTGDGGYVNDTTVINGTNSELDNFGGGGAGGGYFSGISRISRKGNPYGGQCPLYSHGGGTISPNFGGGGAGSTKYDDRSGSAAQDGANGVIRIYFY